jgi:glycosyltransferase involved in cell wall biosynthesis
MGVLIRLLQGSSNRVETYVIIDMRCLQTDPHAPGRAVLAQARQMGRVVGIIDPDLPPLDADLAALLDTVRVNAYLPGISGVFINLAPFGPEQLFIARLLLRPDIQKIAVLGGPGATGLSAAINRVWLARYDRLIRPKSFCAAPSPPVLRSSAKHKPQIALLTPLPPARSGVADYSAAMLASLREFADVTVFSPQGDLAISALAHLASRFDRVIGVVGNSGEHHGQIFELLRRYGGACICHDARLLGLYTGQLGLTRTAQAASRELARTVRVSEIQAWNLNETQREADFLDELAQAANPLILHARRSADALVKRGFNARHLPFAIYRPWDDAALSPAHKQAARRRLGWPDDVKLIISLGFINSAKGIAAALQAMALLQERNVAARLVWVGKAQCDLAPWQSLAASLQIENAIIWLDEFISEATYRDYILAADAGLQLRAGGSGNISGALQDCIAAGLPTVTNEDLADNLAAPDYILRVPDMLPPAKIALSLLKILTKPPETTAAHTAYTTAHNMRAYAKQLCKLLGLD